MEGIVAATVVGFRLRRSWIPRLRLMDLSKNMFTYLPKNVSAFTSMTSLTVKYNQLCELPSDIGDLHQLTHLDVNHNELKQLPESMSKLTSLQTLLVNHNRLTALPHWVSTLPNLTLLTASHNPLTTIPEEVLGNSDLLISYIKSTYSNQSDKAGGQRAEGLCVKPDSLDSNEKNSDPVEAIRSDVNHRRRTGTFGSSLEEGDRPFRRWLHVNKESGPSSTPKSGCILSSQRSQNSWCLMTPPPSLSPLSLPLSSSSLSLHLAVSKTTAGWNSSYLSREY